MVIHGPGAEVAALTVGGPREAWQLRQVAGCCARDRGSMGASGIAWDRGNAGATDAGGARLRHDSGMRSKREHGVAMDNGAMGACGMAVNGSMGAQRAHSGGSGVWAKSDAMGAMTGDGGDVITATHGMEAMAGGAAVHRASWGVGAHMGERRVSKRVCVHVRTCSMHCLPLCQLFHR